MSDELETMGTIEARIPAPPTGIYYDVPFAVYRSWDAINYSSISKGLQSVAAMHRAMTQESSEPTKAQSLGTAIHAAILEPDLFAALPIFDGNRGTKGFAAFDVASGGNAITVAEHDTALRHADNALQDEQIRHLVRSSDHEVCMVWHDHIYGTAKQRIDIRGRDFFGDIKTDRDISADSMQRAFCGRYGWNYRLQWGWYREAIEHLGENSHATAGWLIAIETGDDPDAYAVLVEGDVIAAGQREAVEIARRYAAARAVGCYAGKIGSYGDNPVVTLPEWMRDDDQVNMEGIQ